ncbi:MAG: isoleucine--tRNA ligase [Bacteroidia bacterium]|nr:isoleucine--tRNA ligase [Bacteroidia bacterium]
MKKYPEYKQLNLPEINHIILDFWKQNHCFQKSVEQKDTNKQWIFYEGPPSANGMPGIHHVMSRTIKDIFCRYKTMQGYRVERKAGWDTHGLPVELGVEKELGITKEDIGKTISVEEYNQKCREAVMKYTDKWEQLTERMGYWVDMKHPYITYDNNYIESVWWLLKQIYNKGLLYKGYTIQPYSPAAGTGLSSHELNQPGCYKNVKDRSAVVMFKLIAPLAEENCCGVCYSHVTALFQHNIPVYALAWTTTPWTLPSNTGLAVHPEIDYVAVKTYHPYPVSKDNPEKIIVILAKSLLHKYFPESNAQLNFDDVDIAKKKIPYQIIAELKGQQLLDVRYEQLLPFVKPNGKAFRIVTGKFVTTEDGTGIVHIAPSFGEDDFKVAKEHHLPALTLVDLKGRFVKEVKDEVFLYGGEPVKEAYLNEEEKNYWLTIQKEKLKGIIADTSKLNYLSVDERIVLKLQTEGKLFKKELYEHNYPHCWRTDKPILYYPLDSWFIRTTAVKERLIELNKTIHWKPESTGTGRFGNWLENLNDWNLSRSRYWGIPLPIWRDKDSVYELVVSSKKDLMECKAIRLSDKKEFNARGFYLENNERKSINDELLQQLDLHKPFIDNIVFVIENEHKNEIILKRENDLIDVWFDSGSMPYAQHHYPFSTKDLKGKFPADFIAEGVDQTRGWFFTLHAIATMVFDSIAYKNVISNGLVLDKNGNKMSKRLGNVVDPFETLEKYGADATRWYMVSNAAPWDNLKFDINGIIETQRKLFSTLYNTYQFFAMYANVDGFVPSDTFTVSKAKRHELDNWILSKLNSLIQEVTEYYENFEPHRAARAIEDFIDEHLSNWYVRLSRRRFWKNDKTDDKLSAYEILHYNLYTLAHLIAPIAPFFADWLYQNLKKGAESNPLYQHESVHLSDFPKATQSDIDKELEEKMFLAQTISSLILSIRKKENIRVRQPLQLVQIPVLNKDIKEKILQVKEIILNEVNVKNLEVVDETSIKIIKTIKLNFKSVGKKYPQHTKFLQNYLNENAEKAIQSIEKAGQLFIQHENHQLVLNNEDVDILPVDVPGWKVASKNNITVALDVTITDHLYKEGLARELINRIQSIRKEKALDITDRIIIHIETNHPIISDVIKEFNHYICTETLCNSISISVNEHLKTEEELDEKLYVQIHIEKQTLVTR